MRGHWKPAFLKMVSETGVETRSADLVGVDPKTVYRAKKRPEFAAELAAAHRMFEQSLVQDAAARLCRFRQAS